METTDYQGPAQHDAAQRRGARNATAANAPSTQAEPISPAHVEAAIATSMRQLAREFDACRDLLVALGNESRQAIFIALLEHPGGMRVGALAQRAGLSRPATSHHIKVMKDAGLIDCYKVGTKNYYHASPRLDRWGQLAQVTAHAEQFVRTLVQLEARGLATCPRASDDGLCDPTA